MTIDEAIGISQFTSPYPVDDTTHRIEATLRGKGLTIFCVVDHSGEARRVGLEMRPTKLVIFGSPKAGTPVMVASPDTAIDLPLKALHLFEEPDVVIQGNRVLHLRYRVRR